MSVEVLDGATIRDFVEDERSFNTSVDDRFAILDANHDSLLSYAEMTEELRSRFGRGFLVKQPMGSLTINQTSQCIDEVKPHPDKLRQLYGSLFSQFDRDGSGAVDLEEFRAETKKMMLAVANGLGFLPVQMVLEEGSFLKKAVDRESAKFIAV
ncbi:hypothetical protein Taro_022297 [Colocasia esculenta]|uniref:EF-hand domain-containing protein n=1 Tax=Colocasia esculenta TaxID=4460 RepID=A0A843V191_COLES|nr:hypothetical protein [Colocasia esculenta]